MTPKQLEKLGDKLSRIGFELVNDYERLKAAGHTSLAYRVLDASNDLSSLSLSLTCEADA